MSLVPLGIGAALCGAALLLAMWGLLRRARRSAGAPAVEIPVIEIEPPLELVPPALPELLSSFPAAVALLTPGGELLTNAKARRLLVLPEAPRDLAALLATTDAGDALLAALRAGSAVESRLVLSHRQQPLMLRTAAGPHGLLMVFEERPIDHSASLAAALSTTREGVMLVDRAGRVQFANEAAGALYGRPAEKLIGAPFTGLNIVRLDDSGPADVLAAAVSSGRYEGELLRLCADGSCRPTQLRLRAVDDRIAAVIEDTTAHHEMHGELARALKLATLGELTGGITHEIGNALVSVIENSAYLTASLPETNADEDLVSASRDIQTAASRMRGMLEQIRRFSHWGKGSAPADQRFGEAIETATSLAHGIVKRHARIELPEGPGPVIHADQGRLTQVLLNLIKNAVEAFKDSERGSLIRIEHGEAEREGWLRITDDGPGIPQGVLQRLFKEYITTKEAGRGTGFGLSLCAKLLAEDRGRIEVSSELGKGTTFTIHLPLASAVEKRAKVEEPGVQQITLVAEIDPEYEDHHSGTTQTEPAPSAGAPPRFTFNHDSVRQAIRPISWDPEQGAPPPGPAPSAPPPLDWAAEAHERTELNELGDGLGEMLGEFSREMEDLAPRRPPGSRPEPRGHDHITPLSV